MIFLNDITKNTLSLIIRIIVSVIMCFIVTVSINVICTASFTDKIGYDALVKNEKGETVETYTFKYSSGEDKKADEYTDKGYTVTKRVIRSTLEGKGKIIFLCVSQIISLLIVMIFTYAVIFPLGMHDLSAVNFGRIKEDKLKGLKIGLLAVSPYMLFLLVNIVFALGVYKSFPISPYMLSNFTVYQILQVIVGNAKTVSDVNAFSYFLIFLTLLYVPAVSHISYTLGYKDILIFDKLVYKKEKDEK